MEKIVKKKSELASKIAILCWKDVLPFAKVDLVSSIVYFSVPSYSHNSAMSPHFISNYSQLKRETIESYQEKFVKEYKTENDSLVVVSSNKFEDRVVK